MDKVKKDQKVAFEFAPYEAYVAIAVQALFLLALTGQILAYRTLKNPWLLALSVCTTIVLFVGYYVLPSSILLQISLAGLIAASIWHFVAARRCAACALGTPAKNPA